MKKILIIYLLLLPLFSFSQDNIGNKNLMLNLINEYRVENGLSELKYDKTVEKASYIQVIDNMKYDKGGHDNTNEQLKTVEDRLEFVGYESVFGYYWCENAGRVYDYDSTIEVEKLLFDAWKESKLHNLNMLNKYNKKLGYSLVRKGQNYYAIIVFAE